jgi:hypothetical protein
MLFRYRAEFIRPIMAGRVFRDAGDYPPVIFG